MAVALQAGWSTPALAQNDVTVRRAGADTIGVAPGARATIPFVVASRGRVSRTVPLRLEVPSGWRSMAPPADLTLAPDAQTVRIASFSVPPDAPAGVYMVTLRVPGGGADSGFVRVAVQPRLAVSVERAPEWVTAGSSYTVTYRVANSGNVDATVRLGLESTAGFTVRADTSPRRLAPGGTALVEAAVTTPADLPRALTHSLRLLAAAEPDTATANALARIEVLPQGSGGGREPRYAIPAGLRVRLSDDPRAGPPLRVHASGPVRPGGGARMDILLQGPASAYSLFGETDVYRIALQSRRFTLRLGDHVYGLSPLTEPGKDGFGASVGSRLGPVEAGGYVQADRRALRPDTQVAAFLRLSPVRPVVIGMNWLSRRSELTPRDVASVQASVDLPASLRVEGEYGREARTGAVARSVHARAGGTRWNGSVRHMQVDTAYGGAYGGAAVDAAHLAVRPWRELRLETSLEQNAFDRAVGGTVHAQSTRSARARAAYGSRLSIEGLHTRASTRYGDREVERTSRSARVRTGVRLGRIALHPAFEAGLTSSSDLTEHAFWKAMLQTQILASFGTLAAAADYASGGSVHQFSDRRTVSGSASASLRLPAATQLQVSAYGSRQLSGRAPHASLITNAALEHRLGFGHRIAVRMRSRLISGLFQSRETLVLLDYVIPFGLPMLQDASRSAVTTGRVYDAETGEPLARVVLELGGSRAATDAQGRVEFRGVAPGTHYLRLDRASAGVDRTAAQPLPMRVEVESGGRTEFELGLVRAGRIAARVALARATSMRADTGGVEPRDTAGVPGAVLDFVLDGQRVRATTDEHGRVELGDLRPGRWTVSVAYARIPALHRLERDSIVIDIPPAGEGAVEFIIEPVRRRLQIIASGDLSDRPDAAGEQSTPPSDVPPPAARRAAPRPDTAAAPRAATPPAPHVDTPPAPRQPPAPAPAVRTAAAEPILPPVIEGVIPTAWSSFHAVGSATTLMEVARRVYLETSLWPKIWLANLEQVPDPEDIPPGTLLRIPPRAPLTEEEAIYAYENYYRPPR